MISLTKISLIALALGLSSQAFAAKLAAGGFHTCLATSTTKVACWGSNEYSQLGQASGSPARSTPAFSQTISQGIADIVAGDFHTCVLTTGGGVLCWGRGERGQLGDGLKKTSATAVTPTGLGSGVKAIAVGGEHTCALKVGGKVFCWGQGDRGQLANGVQTSINYATAPAAIQGTLVAKLLVASGRQTCAATEGGDLYCWGEDVNLSSIAAPKKLATVPGTLQLAAGEYHLCLMTTGGVVQCMGDGWFGQNGDDDFSERDTPTVVAGVTGTKDIGGGRDHSCALDGQGQVFCWGQNLLGQLGNGEEYGLFTPDKRLDWFKHRIGLPQKVKGLTAAATEIAVGGRHACALEGPNKVKCWGQGFFGQLGNGAFDDTSTAVAVGAMP